MDQTTALPTLGADLRALRRARGLTLADLASRVGRSVGWMSQVEREISVPSIEELRRIAAELSVPMSMLFGRAAGDSGEFGYVVRRSARRQLGRRDAGLVEELLSPDLTDGFEVVHSVFEPGAKMDEAILRRTTEVAYMVSGRLDLEIGARRFTVSRGDSFRFRGEPYRWSNPYAEAATAIWVIAPPVY